MNKTKLYLMCGPAGSGKSTWVRKHAAPGTSAHISRDRIRFNMVKPDEYYFSREDDVYEAFVHQIADALKCPWVNEVYADATNLTKKAREKLIKRVEGLCNTRWFDICIVVVKPTIETCLTQNSQREGRECVPETVIRNMYNSYEDPWNDDMNYREISYIGGEHYYGDFFDE